MTHLRGRATRCAGNLLATRHFATEPSLDEFETIAAKAFGQLPQKFRALCEDLVIRVEDFPTDEVVQRMKTRSKFQLLGLFRGVGLPFRFESAPCGCQT